MKKIGFIGTGIMGCGMIRNLIKHGYTVYVYNRTRSKALPLTEEGAVWCDSPAECAKNKDIVITMVGYPKDVAEVYFETNGIFTTVKRGTYLIDMTTTSPKLSEKIYAEAAKRDVFALDAPVTGGDTGAKNGTLSILVGGDEKAFKDCLPLFQAMGKNIVYEGPAGAGQHTKMVNQIMIAGTVAGMCEALCYAQKAGLDLQRVLDGVSKGAAGSAQVDSLSPRILQGDFQPGFYIKHFIKDMRIADEESSSRGLHLNVLNEVLDMYLKLMADGEGNLGTQALVKYYDDDDQY
ncbi:NAD(P)-dependent oxidoreductase [Megasphaera sueciensis]|jgi:3-hydroxyisobutyrate dehydrogenase/2-hydroxy-3-oxopropionate reductase|uniref:NAD(P)-dependent oxidoreductase n=1 Tax=Megasphaera sueciensis TaxID=349094 RepID=UPI003D024188